jgi:hypothetical protein
MTRTRCWAWASLLLLAQLAWFGTRTTGRAASEQILVLEQGDAVSRALRVALDSWGSDVRLLDPRSVASLRRTRDAARLARDHGAAALIWFDRSAAPPMLNVYVVERDEITAQELRDAPPLTEEAAAAVALSIKTVLRNSAIAPEAERTPPPAPALPRVRFELGLGVRSAPSADTQPRLRYGAAVALFEPWWSRGRLGLSFEAAFSQSAAFEAGAARGSLSEFWFAFAPRGLVPLARFLDLELSAAYELERTQIEGQDELQRSFAASRVNSSLGFGLALDFRVARRVFVAPRFGVHRILQPQRYFVGDELVLELARVALEGALRVGVGWL